MAASGPVIRVLSYNVHGRKDDRDALASVVRTLAPDVVLVQEGPLRFRWRARCADMAHSWGLLYAAGGDPSLGNVILTNHRVRVHEGWSVRFALTPGRHMRGAAFATCSVAGVRFVVAGSHLATDATERPGQARALRAAIDGVTDPFVLGCDVNDDATSETWRTLADGLVDAGAEDAGATFPAHSPRRRIDAIMVDPRATIRRFEVVGSVGSTVDSAGSMVDSDTVRRASDHLPIVCDITLPVIA
jgi:endonuclease/exonuclease/phosphatase family metal-dependent hydrolase